MKKINRAMCVLSVIVFMAAALCACGTKDNEESNESTMTEETVLMTETEEETKPYFEESRDVVEVAVPSDVDSMRPIMIGLCKAMTGGAYEPEDTLFYWEALYSAINGSTWIHPDISLADNGAGYMVPKAVMQEYAKAMFSDIKELPEIPSNMGGIQYIAEEDSYMLYSAGGYVGSMDVVNVTETEGGYHVSVAFYLKNGSVENHTFVMLNDNNGSFPCMIQGIAE